MRLFLLSVSTFIVQLLFAQNPIGEHFSTNTFSIFQERHYSEVVRKLGNELSLTKDEMIILQLSQLKTGENVVSQIEKIIEENPSHNLTLLAYFYVGEYHFYKGDSIRSRKYISKVQPRALSTVDQSAYGFIAGLQALELGNYARAKKLLTQSKKLGFADNTKLTYYLAFSDYHLDRKSSALKGFNESLNNEEYASSSRFFIAKINLDLGKYEEVISLAKSELSEEKSITNSGFYQLIGEAYAKKNNVARADAYFDKAVRLHPKRPSSALYYQAGVSKFKIGNDDKAIEYLIEAGIGTGDYAQLSAFQLGRLYLQRNELENSLVAYTEASVSKDVSIKEESLYHTAKLHAQLGDFTEALNYSDDYLKAFKSGKWVSEIQNLIADTYLRTSNFDLAISHLEKLGIIGDKQQSIYQKVTFQKAQLLFNDALFSGSIEWFKKSIQYPIDTDLKNESQLFIGEAYMAQGQFKNAIQAYSRQSEPSAMTFYGLGYAYYNLEDYDRAIEPFKRFITIADTEMKVDGQLRLADCLYASKNYSEALEIYSSLGRQSESSYVKHQVGLVLKELGEYDQAISSFEKVERDSRWKDNAIYNIASLQFEKADFMLAERKYSELIASSNSKDIISKSLLNRAICYSNLNQLKDAKIDYEEILENHLTSNQALSAILGLQELKQKGFPIHGLDSKIAKYKSANPNDSSLESVEFEAAKAFYFDLDYDQSIIALSNFLKEYPKSSYLPEAKYYIADAYYRSNRLEEALEVFITLKTYRNNFTGRVYSRLGEINYQLDNYKNAIEAYEQLLVLSLSPKDSYNARLGMMKSYFDQADYSNSIELADEIMLADWKPLNAESIAILYKARSLKNSYKLELAKTSFRKIAEGSDAIAAEANFQLALIDFENGEYDSSLSKLFELNDKFGSYALWIDRSYLLIADNYLNTDQLFQSKATLRSIIDHSKNQVIIDLAKTKLKQIEQQSISTDTSNVNKN